MNPNNTFLCVLFGLFALISCVLCASTLNTYDELKELSDGERTKLDEFHKLANGIVPNDFMKERLYLIRFLRAQEFKVPAALEMLKKALKWRNENDIDKILDEDYALFESDFKTYFEGCDREGRPIFAEFVGEWDIRTAVVAGNIKKLTRYMIKKVEEKDFILRELQKSGSNVSQANLIQEMSNFHVLQHSCASCLPVTFSMINLAQYYPHGSHSIWILNMPQLAIPLFDMFKPFIPADAKGRMRMYGRNKEEWQRALLKDVDPSQLTKYFGGKKRDGVDVHEWIQDARQGLATISCSS